MNCGTAVCLEIRQQRPAIRTLSRRTFYQADITANTPTSEWLQPYFLENLNLRSRNLLTEPNMLSSGTCKIPPPLLNSLILMEIQIVAI